MGKEKHPKRVEVPVSSVIMIERPRSDGTIEKLVSIDPKLVANVVANTSYDSLTEFVTRLYEQISSDSVRDRESGKKCLAGNLNSAAIYLKEARDYLAGAWKVCEKYMK